MLLVLRYWVMPALALACAVPWLVIRLFSRTPVRRATLETGFVGYLAMLLYVVLLLPVRPEHLDSIWDSVNLVPARTIMGIVRDHPGMVTWQLLGNVLLFVPLGLLLPLLGARFRRFGAIAAVGLSVSVGIELVQLVMLFTAVSPRSVDIDDVILNVLGACLGYMVWRAAHAVARPWARTSEALEDSA